MVPLGSGRAHRYIYMENLWKSARGSGRSRGSSDAGSDDEVIVFFFFQEIFQIRKTTGFSNQKDGMFSKSKRGVDPKYTN